MKTECESIITIVLVSLVASLLFSSIAMPVSTQASVHTVRFGEDRTITEMNWHEAWKTVPCPTNPGTLPPDAIEFWSTGNSAHTFVSASASNVEEYQSGDAHAIVGIEFYVEGEGGESGNAEITIDFSCNAESLIVNGQGTADAILYGGLHASVHRLHRAHCTTGDEPISCHETFSGDESITFSTLLEAGLNYRVGLWAYSHADVIGFARAFSDVTIHSIQIEFGNPPIASFTQSPAKPMVGGNIIFNASPSYDPDGEIVEYRWDFGDEDVETLSVPTTSHVYEIPDKYNVTLTVTDNDGLTNSTFMELDLTLEKGDLLLWRSHGSLVPGEWTHIGMYIGDNNVVEAIWTPQRVNVEGKKVEKIVDIFPLSDWSWPNQTYVRALKVWTATPETRGKAVEFALSKVGQPYDIWSTLFGKKQKNGEMWYCSELVWAAYLSASSGQIDLDSDTCAICGDAVSPTEIDLARALVKVIGEHKEVRPETVWTESFFGVAYSPVDLIIIDPDGLVLNKQRSEILGAIYEEVDIDEDGDLDDLFAVLDPKIGDYLIQVIPEPDALPTDTYSLEVGVNGETVVLADDVQISDIPPQPYVVEPTETGEFYVWQHIFTDSYGKGTILKINTEHKFFKFITQDNDYGIRDATYMRVRRRTIIIYHKDNELKLVTLTIDTKLDFCIAYAKDIHTGNIYLLIDKPGIE